MSHFFNMIELSTYLLNCIETEIIKTQIETYCIIRIKSFVTSNMKIYLELELNFLRLRHQKLQK